MPAGWRFSAFLLLFVCAASLVLGGVEPTPPWPTPPGQSPGTQGATDTAWYLSTATVEQEMIGYRRSTEGGLGLGQGEPCPDGLGHVPQWGRFEIGIVHPRSYANPYKDVTLEVTFTRPDSSTIAFWGFYDGDDTWRVRALADQPGTWRYHARFSDSTGQLDGTFTCLESDRPGLISPYAGNPIWFGLKPDQPVLVRGLHVSEQLLAEGDGPAADAQRRARFLDWARDRGYNMLSIAGRPPHRRTERAIPGEGSRAALALWDADKQQPDPAAYRRLESVLDDLSARRMLVGPAAGFFSRDGGLPEDPAQQDLYLHYTLARLGSYSNVIWSIGGPAPARGGEPYLTEDEIDRLGREIGALDPFGHLLCVSSTPGNRAVRDADWISCHVLPGPRTATGAIGKPRFAALAAATRADYSLNELRENAYVLMMSAATISVADTGGPGAPGSGLSGTLDVDLAVPSRHDTVKNVWDFFESVPFWRMKPRQDLVDNGYCLAEPGRMYLVYLPEPGAVTVDVGEGMYRTKWINAADTADVRKAGIIEGRRNLTSPQEEDDWLLALTRVEIVAGEIRAY